MILNMKQEQVKDAAIKRGCLRRNIKILSSVITGIYFILCVLYFVTPISTVNNVTITGSHYYETSLINEALNSKLPSGKAYLPTFDEQRYENIIISSKANNTYSLIDNIEAKANMFKLEVNYDDVIPVFKYGSVGQEIAYLGNSDRLPSSLPKSICDIDMNTYISNLPIFFEDSYAFIKETDCEVFASSNPLSISMLSYIKKNSRNTYHLYYKDDDLGRKLNKDKLYIRFTVSDDKIDDFLNGREINNAIKVIDNTSISNISSSNETILNDTIDIVINDRTTNGEN